MTDAGVLSPALRATTVGVFALGFLIAFEALAVTTAMPLAARDLHGTAYYALTFSAFSATGVVGTVLAGALSDRSGPVRPLLAGAALFTAGLLGAGTAGTMPMLIAARAVQGLGAGAIGVALYVLVARVYPERMHPRVFALLAAAWVLPSLVGPFAAGLTAQYLSWHWVFLGIMPLVAAAVALLLPTLRARPMPGVGGRVARRRIAAAALAATALLALRPALGIPVAGPLIAVAVGVVAVAALVPLLPPGTLRAAHGLPAVVATRGLLSAGFAGADAYLPYSLIALRDMPPSLAGGITTVGAVSWAVGSEAQSRLAARLSDRACLVTGATVFAAGLVGVTAVTAFAAPIPVLAVAWLCTGLGIGLAYPRTSTSTLAMSEVDEQGANSAALQIGDGFGNGFALTLTGVAVVLAPGAPFVAAFGTALAVGVLTTVTAPRTGALTR